MRMKTKHIGARVILGLCVSVLVILATMPVYAQEMKYKVGDHVEVDTIMSSTPANAKYREAIIVGIDDKNPADKAYLVQIPGYTTQTVRYMVKPYTQHWIRDVQGGGANATGPANGNPGNGNPANGAGGGGAGLKYKVGDRVETDIIQALDPKNAQWRKGTVIKVDTSVSSMAYIIQLDPAPGKLPMTQTVPIRPYAEGWLRPIGGAAPTIATDRLRVDQNNTVLADRELLDCKNMKRGPAKNGDAPSLEFIKRMIQCTFERPSDVGQDGARKMDIVSIAPQGSRRWDPYDDISISATANTIVYQYHVKYNKKTFYRTSNQSETGSERNYSCYVSNNEWYCGTTAGGVRDGVKTEVRVQK